MKVPETIIKSIAQPSINIFKSIGRKIVDEVKIVKALENYVDNYIKRYGHIKVIGMTEPISLNDIYTKVNIISPSYRTHEREISELEDNFRESRHHIYQQRSSGIKLANEKNKLNVLGAPGSGKSTFLKYMGIEAFKITSNEDAYIHECIPVLVELKRFRNEEINLEKIIQNEFEIAGFPESSIFINRALKSGILLILLDGLDEVPTALLGQTIEHIKDFTDKYSKNRYITSCRTAFYKTYLKDFTDVEIASFDDEQIKRFIANWFNKPEDQFSNASERFIDLLFKPTHEASLELGRTPLLLTFLCLTFDESQKFPANRSGLYKRALMILLDKWAAEKRIHNEDIHEALSSELEIEMLSDIAAIFYTNDKFFFYENELKNGIQYFLENTLNMKNLPISKIIEAIEVQQGLLVQRAPEIYSFSHLTIQEYLTAHYFNSPTKTLQLIEDHIFDRKWREVFLLLAGMGNGDDLIVLINDYLKNYLKEKPIIVDAVIWVNKMLPKSEDFETDAFKRTFLVSLLLRYKRYPNDAQYRKIQRIEMGAIELLDLLNSELQESTKLTENITTKEAIKIIDLISGWKKSKSDLTDLKESLKSIKPPRPLNTMLMGSRYGHKKKILEPVYAHLQTPNHIAFARKNKYDFLQKYIDGYILLIECKQAALRVSKDVWKNACSSIFKA